MVFLMLYIVCVKKCFINVIYWIRGLCMYDNMCLDYRVLSLLRYWFFNLFFGILFNFFKKIIVIFKYNILIFKNMWYGEIMISYLRVCRIILCFILVFSSKIYELFINKI